MKIKQLPVTILLIVLSFVFCLGLGSKQENNIPIPLDSFAATIIDQAGVETKASDISIEGKTFLTSQHGKGVLFVEFQEIDRVIFSDHEKKQVTVTINLTNGETMKGTLNASEFLYGNAKFGKFKIKLREIASISFHHAK